MKFQISQRAEFFEEVVGLETTLKRPIVNTRDEPHADPRRFRRLHVIVGDANLSEVATFLKVGTTALVLAMIEDDVPPPRDLALADPVRAMHQVSADLSLSPPAGAGRRLDGHRARDPVGAVHRRPQVRRRSAAWPSSARRRWLRSVLDRWEAVLHGLETDPSTLVAPARLGGQVPDHAGLPGPARLRWDDDRLAALDLQYHDLRPERSLFARLGMERLVGDEEVAKAVTEPPPTPGPGSGASAWPGGPTPWSRPTGTRSSSTWVRTPSAASL